MVPGPVVVVGSGVGDGESLGVGVGSGVGLGVTVAVTVGVVGVARGVVGLLDGPSSASHAIPSPSRSRSGR